MNKRWIGCFLSALFFLSGCSDLLIRDTLAPVVSIQSLTHKKGTSHHKVRQGETLYEIAWKYGIDYRDLAGFNYLNAPYTIYPGQRLTLKPPALASKQKVAQVKPLIKSYNTLGTWIWPLKGAIIKPYAEQGTAINKGIDIAGNLGTPVLATKAGKVVYAGEGLRGYGKLIIVKHSDDFLSAYAHNHTMLVQEGSDVTSGQPIATLGKTGTDQIKLHFEIRQNGKPVDPLRFLPARETASAY